MKKIRARAPVRIDFLGGGSDAPPFVNEHGGHIINAGLNRYATCLLEVGPEIKRAEIISNDINERVAADSAGEFQYDGRLDLLKAAVKLGGLRGPFRLTTDVGVPPQSGLGASSALVVCVLAACHHAKGRPLDRRALARLAYNVERGELKMAGGSQDHYGGAFGGIHHYMMRGDTVAVEPIRISPAIVAEFESRLVLAYTGVTHLSGSIHSDIRAAYADDASPCKQAMFGLARIGREGVEPLERGDFRRFAELLNENWRYHKNLHASCTNAKLDHLYEVAGRHGMIGGKTCGAGGGGCIVFLCEDGRAREVAQAIEAEGCQLMPFNFDFGGVLAWDVLS